MRTLTIIDRLFVWLIFCHYLIYELVFFFYYDFAGGIVTPFVSAWKLAFPVVLFIYGCVARGPVLRRVIWPLAGYLIAFCLFLIWAVIPSILSPFGAASILEWLKLLPRALFFLGLVGFVLSKPKAFDLLIRILVGWAVICVVQYSILVISRGYETLYKFSGIPVSFAGPYGLLGNVSSLMTFPGLSFQIARLCGFWNEPSNASASLFAAFFFSRYLFQIHGAKRWRYASYVLFVGGVLCLSNAGYLAIAIALAFGSIVSRGWRVSSSFRRICLLAFGLTLILIAVFGRGYVAEKLPDNDWARAFVGARELNASGDSESDPYGGRIDLLTSVYAEVVKRPIGLGIPPFGRADVQNISATAPVYWLLATGIIGCVLLLLREGFAAMAAFQYSRRSLLVRTAAQAWIVVVVQQSVYGSWMNPLYFIVTTGLLTVAASHFGRDADISESQYNRLINVKAPASIYIQGSK